MLNNFRLKWSSTDRGQKVILGGGLAAFAFVLLATFYFASKPHYSVLYTDLSEAEQGQVIAELEGMQIDAQLDAATGTIRVPADKVARLHADLAKSGKQPHSQNHWGIEQTNKMPFGATPGVEQEQLKAIREGQIATSIETMQGISAAQVHLTMPGKALFVTDQKPATASISITESQDAAISAGQGRTIALLVCNAVEGMEPKNVVVVNQKLQVLWNGADQDSEGISGASHKTDLDEAVSKKRQQELQALLDGAFGIGSTLVTVHADVDMDPAKTISDLRSPSEKPKVSQNSVESVSGNGAPKAGGLAGVAANIAPVPAGGTTPGGGNYKGETKTKEFLQNDVHTETTKSTGSIKAMSINVAVDSSRITDPKSVRNLVVGEVANHIQLDGSGIPLPNQPYAVTITPVEFDKTAVKEATVASTNAAGQAKMQQLISLLPIGALLLVALMVVKQVSKFARSSLPTPMGLSAAGVPLAFNGANMPALDGTVNHLLAQIQSMPTGSPGHQTEEELEVEDIKNRIHMPLEQLKKMATERPSVVAQLLKSMLLEDRR